MPTVYNPDHTAYLRRLLARMSVVCAGAVCVSLTGMFLVANAVPAGNGAYHTLAVVAWAIVMVGLAVSAVGLLLSLAFWIVYQRWRAELDAAGAEVDGERRARMHGMQ